MPVGGGTFTVQNKTLPGAYYQFRASGNTVSMGARGIAALPLELPWGPENQIYSLAAGDFNQLALKDLGYDPTASELLLVREALKRAKTLLIYRVNSGGAKAAVTVGGLSVTARYGGTRGNALKAAVLANADNSANVDVVTYLDGTEMDRQTVAKSGGAAGLKANDYVTFSTPATLTAAAAASLTGGTNGTVNGSAYTAWMNALEVEDFNVLGYPGTDDSVKSLVTAFVKRLRDDEGKYITGVLYQHTSADSIGIISVKNGVKLSDGTVITGDKAVAWVTGASAAAEINESLTNTTYDDAVDVDIKYTKGQYEAALKAGEFVFYAEKGKARVLSDINSRTTFGICPKDVLHPMYDCRFYADHITEQYEMPMTIQGVLRAIEAVKETLEDRKLRETERYRFVASILDSGATPDGQIVMVSVFLPLIEAVRQRQVLNRNDPVLTPIFAIK